MYTVTLTLQQLSLPQLSSTDTRTEPNNDNLEILSLGKGFFLQNSITSIIWYHLIFHIFTWQCRNVHTAATPNTSQTENNLDIAEDIGHLQKYFLKTIRC